MSNKWEKSCQGMGEDCPQSPPLHENKLTTKDFRSPMALLFSPPSQEMSSGCIYVHVLYLHLTNILHILRYTHSISFWLFQDIHVLPALYFSVWIQIALWSTRFPPPPLYRLTLSYSCHPLRADPSSSYCLRWTGWNPPNNPRYDDDKPPRPPSASSLKKNVYGVA